MKFVKKPVEVEAWQVQDDLDGCPKWLSDEIGKSVCKVTDSCFFRVRTQHGWAMADFGDWIIRGVKGELYPCKHDIFLATYEPADGAARGHLTI